ncbi:MAG: PASTA domain-containing protein, partial [Sediminibacterium sp.]|nr:PASTA domain-containing protein [Sediminibacterium sp.]
YPISPSEPGSTFKLATMMALLEDKKISLNQGVDLEGGTWKTAGQVVYDSEKHGRNIVSVKQAFELSSNVGMAKLASAHYASNPSRFIAHLKKMRMDTLTGIDLTGERNPTIFKPGHKLWGPTTLPWMAFGYNLAVSPLQTLSLYNAVANDGKMMKPYLVSAIKEEGVLQKSFAPTVVDEKICSDETLKQLRECLEGVCISGTAALLFKGSPYAVAGKTGTALVANGNRGYADKIYQSSFAGYFPANDPQYTCIVVIKNKPHAAVYYGGSVAGPVFKEIADRLFSTYVRVGNIAKQQAKLDSSYFMYAGFKPDVTTVTQKLNIPFKDSSRRADEWVAMSGKNSTVTIQAKQVSDKAMPLLKGMGLKDVVYLCENLGLKVQVQGKGKVVAQSILPGQQFAKGQLVNIALN